MRLMGMSVNGKYESGAPTTLVGEMPTDSGAKWISGGTTADGKPIWTQQSAQANPELQQYIIANANLATNSQVPSQFTYDRPGSNGWGFKATGLFTKFDQADVNYVRNTAADTASMVSMNAGRFSSVTGAAAEVPSPYAPGFASAAFAGTVIGFGAGVVEQLARPNPIGFGVDSTVDLLLYRPSEKFPLLGPMINEIGNEIKKSTWLNKLKSDREK
ncbi:hypothetical protein [Burkholderia stabilis]